MKKILYIIIVLVLSCTILGCTNKTDKKEIPQNQFYFAGAYEEYANNGTSVRRYNYIFLFNYCYNQSNNMPCDLHFLIQSNSNNQDVKFSTFYNGIKISTLPSGYMPIYILPNTVLTVECTFSNLKSKSEIELDTTIDIELFAKDSIIASEKFNIKDFVPHIVEHEEK